ERWLSLDPACSAPLEKIGHEPIDRGGQQGAWHGHEVCLRHAAWHGDRLVQRIRWSQTRNRPDIPKVCSKEPIELLFIIGIEVVPIPPEPIAAFGGIEFVPGGLRAIRGKRGSDFGEMGSGVTDEVPSPIIFLVADPDLIVLIDPRTGVKVADAMRDRRGLERLGDRCGRGASVVVIERAGRAGLVEKREKLFATLVVMFPWIFPVKDNGDGDLFLRRVVNDLAYPAKDILGGSIGSSLVVDEPKGI